MLTTILKRVSVATLLASFAIIAFAEEAPVYDVDSYPPQFDGQPVDTTQPPPQQQAAAAPQEAPLIPADQAPQQQQLADAGPGPMAQAPQAQQTQPTQPAQPQSAMVQRSNSYTDDTSGKIDELQTKMQTMQGQLDEANHQIQLLQSQQKTMYLDLDKRLSQKGASTSVVPSPSSDEASAETDSNTPAGTIKPKVKTKKVAAGKAIATPAVPTAVAATTQPNSAEEQAIYQTAYSQIKAKKYNDAATTLQGMLQKYPTGQFAANAHYWLGELYGLMGKNDQAITEFDSVVKNYSESPKIADAQLKLGLLYAAQFKWPDAKTAFKKVIANYPGTTSSRLAAEQLKQIKTTGH
jgi:tol-pal system protein YbgF